MPTIKIENKSDDNIVITLDNEEKELADGESVFFENKEKGNHTLNVHRKRVPGETASPDNAPRGLAAVMSRDEKPGSHIQLDSEIVFDVNSSKSAISVIQEVKGIETLHEDVVFVGYSADISGAKLVEKKDRFASEKIKKTYIRQQLKGAFLPVGLVGIIILLVSGLFCIMTVSGYPLDFGSGEVSLKRFLLIFAGGVLVTGYFSVTVFKILKRAKSLC